MLSLKEIWRYTGVVFSVSRREIEAQNAYRGSGQLGPMADGVGGYMGG